MYPAVVRPPFTVMSTCLIILVFCFVPVTIFQINIMTKCWNEVVVKPDPTALAVTSTLNEAVNSATGKLFGGQPMRSYPGKRIFRGFAQETVKVAVAPKTDPDICDKWNVVTTIFAPSEAVLRAVSVEGWCTVIVADTKTPPNYMQDSQLSNASLKQTVHYLSVEDQQAWYQRNQDNAIGAFLEIIPFRHFSRKNVGYLYAIQQGAKLIFDFDDDNLLPRNNKNRRVLPALTNITHLHGVQIVQSDHVAFNHHALMGVPIENSWARGFPLQYIQNKSTQGTLRQADVSIGLDSVGVLQFCVDGNPDIDAVHRLVHPLPILFRQPTNKKPILSEISTHGALLVPINTFAPYNAQATVHTYKSLWALLLLLTVPGRVSDIWRAYFAQAIFRHIGLSVVMLPPSVQQERNEHNYLADMQAELDLYFKSGKLLEFLNDWNATTAQTVPEQMEGLWIELYERGYIELEDVVMMQRWLSALVEIDYVFPPTLNL
jgi:hypothetical protein